jgi:hypothetical protein
MQSWVFQFGILLIVLCQLNLLEANDSEESRRKFAPPQPKGKHIFYENFEGDWKSRWTTTGDSKYQGTNTI